MSDCEKCTIPVQEAKDQFNPFVESPRSGGCTRCKHKDVKYNKTPCKECQAEETTDNIFPRFEKSKMFK